MEKYPVWDFPTRLFHWLLAAGFCGSWITAEAGFDWTNVHFYFGYTTLGLVLFRFLWGLFGTPYARFCQFATSPWYALKNISQLLTREPSGSYGHSPAGGWAVMIMLVLMGTQATTGLFVSDDIFWAGPYNPAVSNDTAGTLAYIHHTNFTVLQVVIALHLLVILWYQFGKQENLTSAMVSGNKLLHTPPDQSVKTPWGRFALLALISAAMVTTLIQLAPEPSYLDF